MNLWERENAVSLETALKETGFQVSQICCSRPSCFDFAAEKKGKTVLIKLASDVDIFSPQDSRELKIIAGRVSAASLLISQQTHCKPLEDDTVYSRYSVFVVTEKTLKNIAFHTGDPLVYAGPGGYSVQINGKLVEKRRKELGLSVGKLAEMIGVSRRTLYGYERGMAKASVASAYKLAKTLGLPVAKPINILEKTLKQHQCLLVKAKHALVGQALLRKIFRKFSFCDISPVQKAPFDFIMKVPSKKCVIIGSVSIAGEENLDDRMEEILSISRVIHAQPILITEKSKPCNKDMLCVCMDDLSVMRNPEDLFK